LISEVGSSQNVQPRDWHDGRRCVAKFIGDLISKIQVRRDFTTYDQHEFNPTSRVGFLALCDSAISKTPARPSAAQRSCEQGAVIKAPSQLTVLAFRKSSFETFLQERDIV
jgi:hypothetical protein